MFNYIFFGIFLYLIVGFLLYISQRRLTFNKSNKPEKPEKYGLEGIEELYIITPDKISLISWFKKPQQNKPILIYFHGNSYDIGERSYRIERYINHGWGILLLSWRGYSGNKGKPTEKNLYIDGQAAIDWVINIYNYSFNNIILYGESLGCSVAVELGLKYKFKSIILEAPFISLTEIAKSRYPIYPVKYLILDKFDNLQKIEKLLSPLLIIHGKKDEIIPYKHSELLYNKAKVKKKYVCVDEAMHNNLYDFNIDKEIINFNS